MSELYIVPRGNEVLKFMSTMDKNLEDYHRWKELFQSLQDEIKTRHPFEISGDAKVAKIVWTSFNKKDTQVILNVEHKGSTSSRYWFEVIDPLSFSPERLPDSYSNDEVYNTINAWGYDKKVFNTQVAKDTEKLLQKYL